MPQPSTPGNPHFQFADSALGAAQADNRNAAKAGIAQARATLALAYEQRTASLIALRSTIPDRSGPDSDFTRDWDQYYLALTQQINANLGLSTDEL